jgi:hypothetical protein
LKAVLPGKLADAPRLNLFLQKETQPDIFDPSILLLGLTEYDRFFAVRNGSPDVSIRAPAGTGRQHRSRSYRSCGLTKTASRFKSHKTF